MSLLILSSAKQLSVSLAEVTRLKKRVKVPEPAITRQVFDLIAFIMRYHYPFKQRCGLI